MNDANDIAPAFYIDHEVRIQMIEKNWHLISESLGTKKKNSENLHIHTVIFLFWAFQIFVTNMCIIAGIIRHW